MARARSPEKRRAILDAATHEIAQAGLGAPTARIAARAAIAEGTLFTYFPTKQALFNELYIDLKLEVYTRINAGFPHGRSLERRTRHIWQVFLDWSIEFPDKRKATAQLHLSELITPATRLAGADRGPVDETLADLGRRGAFRTLPPGFAAATIGAMQQAAIDLIAKHPRRRTQLIDQTFQVFWRAAR